MNRRAAVLLLCISLILGLTGCMLTEKEAGSVSSEEVMKPAVSVNEQLVDETVFPKDKVVDVKITVDPADFQDMLDNAGDEEYKTASVNYNGQQMDNIAVRTKGNLSLRSVINSDSDRYSFKLSFDEYIAGQSLNGITKINLNNNYSDASYMREFLAYELAEELGLPTPKYSFVNVYVNDELRGFYLAVEQVGEAYLERNFGNAAGALYKANGGNGSELSWLEKMSAYTGLDLKSASSNDDIILKMLDELNNGTDYESVLDVEEALKFIALNTLSANMDSYLGQNKHNYYLYEDDGVFSVLPWDYNMAFGGLGGSGILIDEPTQGALAERPLIAKLLAVDAYKERYHEYMTAMIQGYLSDEAFGARVQEVAAMISTYVEKDPTAFYTYAQYEQGVVTLKSFVSQQVALFQKQLDGTSPSSGDGSGSGGGMSGGMGGMGMRPGGQRGTAAGGANAGAAAFGQAQEGERAQPGQGWQMQPPNGQGGPGEVGGGFGGMRGGPGGMGGGPGWQAQQQPEGSVSEAILAGGAAILLLISCLIIIFFKRKRL